MPLEPGQCVFGTSDIGGVSRSVDEAGEAGDAEGEARGGVVLFFTLLRSWSSSFRQYFTLSPPPKPPPNAPSIMAKARATRRNKVDLESPHVFLRWPFFVFEGCSVLATDLAIGWLGQL